MSTTTTTTTTALTTVTVNWPPISLTKRVFASLRAAYVMLITEGLYTWEWRRGKRNEMADMEGPYYISGAPARNIEPGKAVIAADEDLKDNVPFLLVGQVVSTAGKPLPNVRLDFWQANSKGVYYLDKFRLRGIAETDEDGSFELLTVSPGAYGPGSLTRAGHFHIILTTPHGDTMTTQLYVCPRNNPVYMGTDFLNWFRKPRHGNILQTFSLPTDKPAFSTKESPTSDNSTHFMNLPSFDELEQGSNEKTRVKHALNWWNEELAVKGLTLGAGAYKVIKMAVEPKSE